MTKKKTYVPKNVSSHRGNESIYKLPKTKNIIVDYSDTRSIKEAEKRKARLENLDYAVANTTQVRLDKFKITFKKIPRTKLRNIS